MPPETAWLCRRRALALPTHEALVGLPASNRLSRCGSGSMEVFMKQNAFRSVFFALTMVSLPCYAANDTPTNPGAAAHPELVVSTQWLADHLNDPKLVIVQIGHDVGDYRAGHIPGARFLSMDKFVDHHTPPEVELLPPDQLRKNLQEIGIGDDTRVVYYAPDWDPMATRLFFTMDYIGHGNQAA